MNLLFVLLIIFAYMCGSIPFGKIIGKYYGVDIQKHGSGNIGFANAVRVLGWKAGILVLLGDVCKGFIPVAVALQYLNIWQVLVVASAAIIGHIFPMWLRFKGGKGIATGLGITLAISPALALLGLCVYIICFALFKKSAPSSVVAACSLPILCIILSPNFTIFYAMLACLALWTHRSNVKSLLAVM